MRPKPSILVFGAAPGSLTVFRGPLIKTLVDQGYRVTAAAVDIPADIAEQLRERGAEPYCVNLARSGMNPLRDLWALIDIIRMMRAVKPDIVFSYTAKPVIWGTIAARIFGVRRVVAMITGLGYAFIEGHELSRRIARRAAVFLYRLALKRCDAVLFQNPDDLETFRKLRLLPQKLVATIVNGSGVELDLFVPAPVPDQPSFLILTRLLKDKGVREYCTAAAALKARFPQAVFRLGGLRDPSPNGISENELQGWIAQGVEYLGPLADVRPALAQASVYVLPSYREGTPRSVLEAMAMGRAIITTDAPGCRETVTEGRNGFLVPPRDSVALEAAMEKFLSAPTLAGHMGAQSLAIATEKYDARLVARLTASSIIGVNLGNEKPL